MILLVRTWSRTWSQIFRTGPVGPGPEDQVRRSGPKDRHIPNRSTKKRFTKKERTVLQKKDLQKKKEPFYKKRPFYKK